MSKLYLPPSVDDGVFAVTASCVIDAPKEKVWEILCDFGKYEDWNPFVRGQTLVDASGKPLEDQTPREGRHLYISPVHLPPSIEATKSTRVSSAFEIITVVDRENYRLAWQNVALPEFLRPYLMFADRWQMLSEVEGGKTKYEAIEVFNGLAAYFIKWIVGAHLQQGFEATGVALKARAEGSR
ncbi:hypothetical protein BD626DRAFT_473953 [Schizophyllum amplum]|uniref:Coenzyme Q-binding protein COQ10 START domain-containing protein n=1 Tax=Schizophyllum amplum TaxID=97359 RepID=A0A550CXB0_9AGAR|nr:hypothetical protein BD626DRAFT_473953 [Auriculariopsis ampla]